MAETVEAGHTKTGVEMRKAVSFSLTTAEIAEAFMALDDDQQAQFFVECARIEKSWYVLPRSASMPPGWQPHAIGLHLATCACSTSGAREFVRAIAAAAGKD